MIIAMAGHRIDEMRTRPPRFPLENLELVEDRIRELLEREEVTAVASSAACGADLLMLRQAGFLVATALSHSVQSRDFPKRISGQLPGRLALLRRHNRKWNLKGVLFLA